MDKIFNALADKSRRYLLDLLYEKNGQSLNELCSKLEMSRQAVSKHLLILENADIVIFDPNEKSTKKEFVSKSSNSPFIGQELYGKVKYTICNGKIVYQD